MKEIIGFSAACAAVVAIVVGLFLALGGAESSDLHGNGLAAAILGLVFTSALGIALMALIFASNTSRHDEAVYRLDKAPEREAER